MRDLDSDKSKLVVLYIKENGDSTVQELKNKLSISLLELYPVLRKLLSKNKIEKTEEKNTYRVV